MSKEKTRTTYGLSNKREPLGKSPLREEVKDSVWPETSPTGKRKANFANKKLPAIPEVEESENREHPIDQRIFVKK